MAQGWAESTWEINNYGRLINQSLPNIIKSKRQFERIYKKICRQNMSIRFNQIYINEEMMPIYIYIYIYSILSPVKPELGVIPSGQEIIHE